jgi:hypothetical protein
MARPEVTGKKQAPFSEQAHDYVARGPPPVAAYTIPEFCRAYRISRAHYYVLKKCGLTPDEIELLGRKIITFEAATRWHRKHTAAARKSA